MALRGAEEGRRGHALFERFDARLKEAGLIAMSGQIVDASLIAAPRQRNTDGEKKAIKEAAFPMTGKTSPQSCVRQDRDARWTVKVTKAKPKEDGAPQIDLAIPVFGYQNHVSIDRGFGFIRKWSATDKKPTGRAMPEAVRRANAAKSKIRSRVEHVFAEQKDRMGLFIRTIGIARATTKVGLANLVSQPDSSNPTRG